MEVKYYEFELGKYNYMVLLYLKTMEGMTFYAMLNKEQIQIDFPREIYFTN